MEQFSNKKGKLCISIYLFDLCRIRAILCDRNLILERVWGKRASQLCCKTQHAQKKRGEKA